MLIGYLFGIGFFLLICVLIGFIIYDCVKCRHEWEQVHDTKYDNVGFRDKYPIILVCTKCGKVKVIK